MRLKLESGIVSNSLTVSLGPAFYRYEAPPRRYERISQRVLVIVGLNGLSTAYSIARNCIANVSSTKQNLLTLRREGLVRVTAQSTFQNAMVGTPRTRAELWGLTHPGMMKAIDFVKRYDSAVDQIAANYPFQAIKLNQP